jgi:hypothetical protein
MAADTWQVNGEAIESAHKVLQAAYGPVSASDCVVAWDALPNLDCGAPNKLTLAPKNLKHGLASILLAILRP